MREPITKKASGGYEYLADTAVGINERDRISENMLCGLAAGAKDMSYEKASRHITGGKISRQTVMNCVRESRAEATESTEKRAVSELHIDSDEAHVTLIGGKKSIAPLVSVYEGIENKYRNNYDKEIREALNEENLELYEQLTDSLIMQNPDRAETISQNAAYLQRFVKGISICKKDERANNGGCTEPKLCFLFYAFLAQITAVIVKRGDNIFLCFGIGRALRDIF